MKHQKKWMMILAGILAAGAVSAQAAQVEINMGGSSAGFPFATQVPLTLFKPNSVATPVVRYLNGAIASDPNNGGVAISAGKIDEWTGTLDGTATGNALLEGKTAIIRYAASGSADGIRKLQTQTVPFSLIAVDNSAGFMTYIDPISNSAGCGAPVAKTGYSEVSGCTNLLVSPTSGGSATGGPVHLGASDVQGSSFGQTGPLGVGAPKFDQSLLENKNPVVVPFKIVVGSGVKKHSDPQNLASPLVPITNLTRLQIEAIFGPTADMGGTRDWRRFGFVPDTDGNGIDDGGVATITLCPRRAGSGTKAAFDQTVMINETEIGTASSTVIFGTSTQDVVNCMVGGGGISAHPLGIAYVDADVLPEDPADPNFNSAVVSVGIDGVMPYNHNNRLGAGCPAFGTDFVAAGKASCDPRAFLMDGKYPYWVQWNMNRRPDGFTGITGAGGQDDLMKAYIAKASNPTVINSLPAGNYWAPIGYMCVTKSADKGPHKWLSSTTTPVAPAHCPASPGGEN